MPVMYNDFAFKMRQLFSMSQNAAPTMRILPYTAYSETVSFSGLFSCPEKLLKSRQRKQNQDDTVHKAVP